MDGGVGHQHALLLGSIAAPHAVLLQGQRQGVPGQNGAVEGADSLDVQRRRLFQQALDLDAVLAHDVDIVPARLVHPGGIGGGVPEPAETVGGEQGLGGALIGHHHFRPVDHGGHEEAELVRPQLQNVPLLHGEGAPLEAPAGEGRQHGEGLDVAHQGHAGELVRQGGDAAGVVGLHVVDHQVVRGAARQGLVQVRQPFIGPAGVHRVHHGHFLVQNHIGVITDAVGHHVLALKQVDIAVKTAHRHNGRVKLDAHGKFLPFLCSPGFNPIILL